MLNMDELTKLSAGELNEKMGELKKELMRLRFQAKTGKLERQNSIRETKKDIARILTAVNAKSEEVKVEK